MERKKKTKIKYSLILGGLGYSLVGIFSVFFGIILGIFNDNPDNLSTLTNIKKIMLNLNYPLIFLVIFNMIFISFIYLIYRDEESYPKTFLNKTKIKLYTCLINIIMFLVVNGMGMARLEDRFFFHIAVLFYIFVSFSLSSIVQNAYGDSEKKEGLKKVRFRLVLPSLLFISLPIYFFASYEKRNVFSIIGLLLLVLFLISILLTGNKNEWKYIKITNGKRVNLITCIYLVFTFAVVIFMIFDFILETNPLASRTLFLSLVVGLYLSIYEGWLIIFPINSDGKRIRSKFNKNVHNTVIILTVLFPAIVAIVFLWQQASLIYIVTYAIVHLISQIILITCVLIPNPRDVKEGAHRRKTGKLLRSILGITVLICLLCDKLFSINVLQNVQFDENFLNSFSQQLNIVLTALPIIITIPILDKIFHSAFSIIFTFTKNTKIEERWETLSLQFLVCYLTLLIFIIFIIPFESSGEKIIKIFSSICLLLLFLSFDICLLYKEYIFTKNSSQNKQYTKINYYRITILKK